MHILDSIYYKRIPL